MPELETSNVQAHMGRYAVWRIEAVDVAVFPSRAMPPAEMRLTDWGRDEAPIIGKCRRGIYQLIATDQLKAVKSGRSTLVVYESLKQYAANLPVAKFRAPHGATPKA